MRRLLSSMLIVLAVAGALVLVLVMISSVATEQGTSEVGREGQTAIMAEATLSSASTTQNAAAFAVVLEKGRATGRVPEAVVQGALDTLRTTINEYESRASTLIARLGTTESGTITASSAVFLEEMRRVTDALSADGEIGTPRVPALDTNAYQDLEDGLVAVRDTRVREVLVAAENVGQVADAVRFLVVVVIPIGAIVLLRSVYRRRRERDALEAELQHQRELSTQKDEFLTNLSHELKTPLTGIYGFALALDEDGLDDPDLARELTGHIITEAGELSRMVDDLITAGQIETGNVGFIIDDVEVDAVVESVIEPYLRTGHTIDVVPGECTAEADPRRLQQIVRTLVSNAVCHGGPNIEIFSEYGAGMLSLFVMDDGEGIDEGIRERLFEPYVHDGAEPLLAGSVGLGLSIARSLAVAMDGSLSYTRSNGLTYFVVKLPAHKVSRLAERVVGTDHDDDTMYDTRKVAKLFSR
ncbi:MAG: HAMP domain-containing histidine kinase [Actinomycetia bacterium]|nr:HAMP domain-containing histidine kinase [Actinomycetes bacterium]